MLRTLILAVILGCGCIAQTAPEDRITLKLDTSEAEAVLAILDRNAAKQEVVEADWQRLFNSTPYVRLKKREASMHRDFSNDDFRRFVLSPELAARRTALTKTLDAWKQADLHASAANILPYLPANARVRASVYPMIKPKTNSFVFDTGSDPAIFLYLDPAISSAQFQNTVAHESHHIGLADAQGTFEAAYKAAPPKKKQVLRWSSAFGEGLAVLAAAGGTNVHPMRDFSEADRIRWDQDMKYFDQQFAQLDQFFRDILSGGFTSEEVSNHVAFTFFGYRGPWYVVGYRMGALVETRFGRPALLEAMTDPRQLLLRYNQAASDYNKTNPTEKLPLWSDEVIDAMK